MQFGCPKAAVCADLLVEGKQRGRNLLGLRGPTGGDGLGLRAQFADLSVTNSDLGTQRLLDVLLPGGQFIAFRCGLLELLHQIEFSILQLGYPPLDALHLLHEPAQHLRVRNRPVLNPSALPVQPGSHRNQIGFRPANRKLQIPHPGGNGHQVVGDGLSILHQFSDAGVLRQLLGGVLQTPDLGVEFSKGEQALLVSGVCEHEFPPNVLGRKSTGDLDS